MSMRYRLRTLMILLSMGPPLLWYGWTKYEARRIAQEQQKWLNDNLQEAWRIERQWIYEQMKDDPP